MADLPFRSWVRSSSSGRKCAVDRHAMTLSREDDPCHTTSRVQVARRCNDRGMAQRVPHLDQVCPVREHQRCGAVPQRMRMHALKSRGASRLSDDVIDRRAPSRVLVAATLGDRGISLTSSSIIAFDPAQFLISVPHPSSKQQRAITTWNTPKERVQNDRTTCTRAGLDAQGT